MARAQEVGESGKLGNAGKVWQRGCERGGHRVM